MDDVYYTLEKSTIENTLDISLYIRNYKVDDYRYTSCMYMMLDNILGEYDVETKLGEINFSLLSNAQTESLHNIKLLREEFDATYKKWFK